MKRTVVNIESSFDKINQNQRFVFLGSCFANNIGDHFIHYKLKSIVNPLGVVFHPISLMRLIDRSINENWFTEKDFFEFDSYWFNYELSGTCAKASLKSAITFANNQLVELRSSILNADRLFLTFGSAIGYIKNGEIVANCHKQDGSLFAKKNFKEECLFNIVKSNLELLIKINKNIRVHLTVSPVRHKKEGIVENSRSKATLINLAHNLSDYYPVLDASPIEIDTTDDFYRKELINLVYAFEQIEDIPEVEYKSPEYIDFINNNLTDKKIYSKVKRIKYDLALDENKDRKIKIK